MGNPSIQDMGGPDPKGPSNFNWMSAVFKDTEKHAQATMNEQLADSTVLQLAAAFQAKLGSNAQQYSMKGGTGLPAGLYTISALVTLLGNASTNAKNVIQGALGVAQNQQTNNLTVSGQYVQSETNQATSADPTNTQQSDQVLSALVQALQGWANLQIQ